MNRDRINEIDPIEFRHLLHKNPELSDQEFNTARFISKQMQQFSPTQIINSVGGNGVAVVFGGNQEGDTIVFRAELDAIAVTEMSKIEYYSSIPGIAHLCGHDGHMAILFSLAKTLAENRDVLKGKIVLLFQPSEEIGEGAKRVIVDGKFLALNPDYIFALHNLPKYNFGQIVIKNDIFATASRGLSIKLIGEPSHAGHPENGNNPMFAMIKIIESLNKISNEYSKKGNQGLITIVHIKLGEPSFGVSPGIGKIMATLRSNNNVEISEMSSIVVDRVNKIAKDTRLGLILHWLEEFDATTNNTECVEIIKSTAIDLDYDILEKEEPFTWSEDFASYSRKYKTGIFGLGAGKNLAQLHNSTYDFPDNLIKIGKNIFWNIYKRINCIDL